MENKDDILGNINDNNIKIKEESDTEDNFDENGIIDQCQDENEDENGQNIKNNINNKDKNNNESKEENNDQDECESSDLDIDEDRLTLVQVRDFLKKKRLRKDKKNSLLHKNQNTEQNITYDSNTKSLRNCFCPNQEELENFLKNCEVKEILNDDNMSSIQHPASDIFDPQEFMKNNNISKMSLSVEDLSLFQKKGEEIEYPTEVNEEKRILFKPIMTEAEFISTSIYKSKDKEHKEKAKEQFSKIRKIMSEDVLSKEQKIWLSDFIKYVSKLPLHEIIDKNKKFEIVFDLDNTCMFSYLGDKGGREEALLIRSRYPEKDIKIFQFEHTGKIIISSLIIRKGLKEFVEYIKDLCNFHISTLSVPNYGREAAGLLEKQLGIKFQKFSARTNDNKNKKYMNDLNYDNNFSSETAIIFDDSVSVWEKDSFNVIASKKFYDKELRNSKDRTDRDRNNENGLMRFLNTYAPYSYNKIKDGNNNKSWKSQTIVNKSSCPFYQYKSEETPKYNESYFGEYLTSPKLQLIYMKNVIKVLYCLVFHNDVCISEAIKLIRLNSLNGKCFYLKYLTDEQKNILKDIIKVCGGDIYESNSDSIASMTRKVFLVASKRIYEQLRDKIMIDLKQHQNYILINERFILDSYYFMTDLGESYTDNEYTLYGGDSYN